MVLDLMLHHPNDLICIYASESWINLNSAKLKDFENILIALPESKLKALASLANTTETMAVVKMPDFKGKEKQLDSKLTLFLDRIQDPGNLGTILRTADWFGIRRLFLSRGSVDPFNNKCIQASMSSISRIELITCEIEELIDYFDYQVILGADIDGEDYSEISHKERTVICLGNEANGLSNNVKTYCNRFVTIPGSSLGAESLNVAISGGILLSHFALRTK
jgi:TrmH family RNA methyltransferase